MKLIQKPTDNFPAFYQQYMDRVPNDGQLLQHLKEIVAETETLLSALPEERLLYRYSEGKWTIKDIILHIADCERIIIYRATRIARGDETNLPGFDENMFVENANANQRTIKDLLSELKAVRTGSMAFAESLDDISLNRSGTANNFLLTARLLANHLYGHHKHHLEIIKERYLN